MFENKNILVTGGTGSFGKFFIKRILKNYKPNKVIIYSRDEMKQYEAVDVSCLEKLAGISEKIKSKKK